MIVKRHEGTEGLLVIVHDGRAASTYSWEEFLVLCRHMQAVANGAQSSGDEEPVRARSERIREAIIEDLWNE